MKISGEFVVNIQPQELSFSGKDEMQISRMTLEKTFKGELSAHGSGEMLSAVTQTSGSAGYVAIEQVVGTLSGKTGSFVLQHSGIMNQGDAKLILVVIPDSGAGELKNLSGQMDIRIEDGVHYYDFEYQI